MKCSVYDCYAYQQKCIDKLKSIINKLYESIHLLTEKNKATEDSIKRFIKHIDNLGMEIQALHKEKYELLKKIKSLETTKKVTQIEELKVIERESDKMKIRQELNVLNEDIKELSKVLDNNKLIKKTETDFKKLHMTIYNILKSDIVKNTEEQFRTKTKNFGITKQNK